MKLSHIAVKRPVTTVMVIFIILLLGFVSLTKLSVDLLPQINVPIAMVTSQYSGVGPYEMESLVTRPLEEVLATVSNVKSISSTSKEGSSLIVVEFEDGTDMDLAALDMREKVDMIQDFLPKDATTPMVSKIDPNAFPIIQMAVTGDKGLSETQRIAEDRIKSRIERLPGVASVIVGGGYENEVKITVDPVKLDMYGISIDHLANVLMGENLNLPGGLVEKGNRELLVRTLGEFNNVEEMRNLPILLSNGDSIYLKDIAEITLGPKDLDRISRTDGIPSIYLVVNKQSTANTVQVANRVNKELDKLSSELDGIAFHIIVDLSDYINDSISNVAKNAAIGGVFAILILFLFLRNIRTTFIIGIAIPISVIATFALMYFSGVTINLMTLGGLALGMGMLVDNSIVVLENIYRFRQQGHSRMEAAKEGAGEVGMAVTASTITTVAVFLPIVFVEGITSMLFKELAMTVTFSLLASLFVSLTIVPMLSSKILKLSHEITRRTTLSKRILDGFQIFFNKTETTYKRILSWSLNHKKITIAFVFVIFVISIGLVATVGAEFFPKADEGYVIVDVELPTGSNLQETDKIATRIENIIEEIPEAESLFIILGGIGDGYVDTGGVSHIAAIYLKLKPLNQRKRSSVEIADEIRGYTAEIAGALISVQAMESGMGGASSAPISISIQGDDIEVLKEISTDILGFVERVEGTREAKTSFEEAKPEIQVAVNRDVASKYRLSAAQIAQSLRNNIQGTVATKYKFDGTEIDVVLRSESYVKENISNFSQIQIATPMGITVPLEQVANISIRQGPTQISRKDQVRTINVTADILGRDVRSINNDIISQLENYPMPEGYSYKIGGEMEDLIESFKSLGLALILAILLVYMVLASQFESLLHPFTIMFTVPISFAGGALGLFITQRTVSVPAVIGLLILSGIVVNNGIVLVDYINILRDKGLNMEEAILEAGPTRLRPILMTALTTILGLAPLALGIGEGAETQAPLATVVIGGLLLATLLTLVFIPVMYILFDRISNYLKSKVSKRKKTSIEV
ncbi:efflux RND transporter permease subunit [Clostridium formicaceticum]|uniref:Multidrug ABC transporter n=1 Tax=Clostridium formicaceticum TaxID=1497 RepID=A0AAC9RIZ4_9CLOT|nr:efflux RND transporter permease subunit [Clostridium formicaceticum]AOY76524.1 multidrug ABC transporter [Clostridium formicaceticum]ARE86936.1 Swarming motility protein SwrC [Clostridium formicaceticum]